MDNAEVLERSYNRIVSAWRALDDDGEQGRSALLEAFGVRFSYNSGRIENVRITYHDTRVMTMSVRHAKGSAACSTRQARMEDWG